MGFGWVSVSTVSTLASCRSPSSIGGSESTVHCLKVGLKTTLEQWRTLPVHVGGRGYLKPHPSTAPFIKNGVLLYYTWVGMLASGCAIHNKKKKKLTALNSLCCLCCVIYLFDLLVRHNFNGRFPEAKFFINRQRINGWPSFSLSSFCIKKS